MSVNLQKVNSNDNEADTDTQEMLVILDRQTGYVNDIGMGTQDMSGRLETRTGKQDVI